MRSAVAGRHVLWRSQVSRSPTAACGGHPQRSSRIAAAACARRAPCEPFEAAPSFLCRGVDAAGKTARCPAIANFTLCGKPRRASYCVLLRQSQLDCDFGRRCRTRSASRSGRTQGSAGGTRQCRARSQDGWPQHDRRRERGQDARGKVPSKRKGAVAAAVDPSRPVRAHHREDARAQVRACTSQSFCVPHFTWAAAAETLPQRHQQTTHSYS